MTSLRPYRRSDACEIEALFFSTVHQINSADYSPEQINAWAPKSNDPLRWNERLEKSYTRVAVNGDKVIGFANLDSLGRVDCLFVHFEWQRRGVAKLLMESLEEHAHELNLKEMTSEVSITARPFFETHGFEIVAEQTVEKRGAKMMNFRMRKPLTNSKEQAQFTNTFPLEIEHTPLDGPRLTLEPLSESHIQEFYDVLDPKIWQWYTIDIHSKDDLRAFVLSQLREQAAGKTFAYAIRDKKTKRIIGGTRFMSIERENRRMEIGSTWYHPDWQRTFANTEAKLLMLTHSFEKLRCICIQFYTDSLNNRSRRAIERLGAKLDGILRFHRICQDGRIRHSAVYSIAETEWPDVRGRLQGLLKKYESATTGAVP